MIILNDSQRQEAANTLKYAQLYMHTDDVDARTGARELERLRSLKKVMCG